MSDDQRVRPAPLSGNTNTTRSITLGFKLKEVVTSIKDVDNLKRKTVLIDQFRRNTFVTTKIIGPLYQIRTIPFLIHLINMFQSEQLKESISCNGYSFKLDVLSVTVNACHPSSSKLESLADEDSGGRKPISRDAKPTQVDDRRRFFAMIWVLIH